jgi:GGDEF domain-containing protein
MPDAPQSPSILSALRQFRDRVTPARPWAQPARPPLEPAAPPPRQPVPFQLALGRDQLTGLPNRACFTYLLAAQATLAVQFETELSVLVIDWPGYAASEADQAVRDHRLATLATQLRGALQRKHDVLARLGNGRLAALLPFTDAAGAGRTARNLQQVAAGLLQAEPAPLPSPPPLDDDMPAKQFGRSAGAPDDDDGPVDPFALDSGDARYNILNIGLTAYCGKGKLDHEVMLRAAEQSAEFASLNGGDHISRSEPDGSPNPL